MIKLLIFIAFAYLFFKILKNAAIVAIESKFKSKSLKRPEELVQCANCERFISKDLAITHKKQAFCSQQCVEQFHTLH